MRNSFRNFEKAEECFDKAIAMRPILTDARNNKAVLYCAQRKYTKVFDFFPLSLSLSLTKHIYISMALTSLH
jgi:tetratricopeptide (TPR) repeat protein